MRNFYMKCWNKIKKIDKVRLQLSLCNKMFQNFFVSIELHVQATTVTEILRITTNMCLVICIVSYHLTNPYSTTDFHSNLFSSRLSKLNFGYARSWVIFISSWKQPKERLKSNRTRSHMLSDDSWGQWIVGH